MELQHHQSVLPLGLMPMEAHFPESEEIGWLVQTNLTAQVLPPQADHISFRNIVGIFVLGLGHVLTAFSPSKSVG